MARENSEIKREERAVTQTSTALESTERAAIDSVPTGLFIGGEWRQTAARLPVTDPATGQLL